MTTLSTMIDCPTRHQTHIALPVLSKMFMSNQWVWPLVEGGKGVSVSNGLSAGSWAACGGIGTFSAVNADYYDEHGAIVPQIYRTRTRLQRHHELLAHAIKGGIAQARIAHDVAQKKGRIHMNILWEMAGAEHILKNVLEGAKGLIHGITCGAGMPYKLAEIAASFKVHYYPIVSSARAFSALWKRSYHRFPEWLGGVVYEDPWLAGGHNGLSSKENPEHPEQPYERVKSLRETMNSFGVSIPIIMAGGVWNLNEWRAWIQDKTLGAMGFQFGTRPLLTQESPISKSWKEKLRNLTPNNILLHKFSPTGFYSSAVKNSFLNDLIKRSERQLSYAKVADNTHSEALTLQNPQNVVYMRPRDVITAQRYINEGCDHTLRTPDSTLLFMTAAEKSQIQKDQTDCMGCLSACQFSGWIQPDMHIEHISPDPRSFCIQKTLQDIAHDGSIEDNLMFAGHNVRFSADPFYADGFTPTVQQLFQRILIGG